MAIPHLFGLTLQNHPTNPNTKINILPGLASSLVDHAPMALAATLEKRLDAQWAPGGGNGMRESAGGAVANATYHVFLIGEDATGDTDLFASLSPVNPSLPSGWSAYRRLGPLLTDENGNIRAFIQTGGWFELVTPIRWANSLVVGQIAANCAVGGPVGVKTLVEVGIFGNASGTYFTACDPDAGAATLPKSTHYVGSTFGFSAQVMADAAGRISLRSEQPCTIAGGYLKKWYDCRDTYA